jgi:CubicO group peptidase (beta-lactamase class C family)
MKLNHLALITLSFSGVVQATRLDTVSDCLNQKYKALTKFNGIVVAVLNADETRIMTFGKAQKNQIFEIGSVTKTFTGNLLAQSVVEGRVKLSDAVPSEYQITDSPITYQHLTTHTSGIIVGNFPDYVSTNPESPYDGITIPVFKNLYGQTPVATKPGEAWAYSNIGTGLLGLVLGENEQVSYENLIIQKIFKPLGMNDSYFEVPASELYRFPLGNIADENEMRPFSHWDLYKTAINPAGGIRSTISDMAIYARANLIPESTPLDSAITLAHQPLYFIEDFQSWIGMNWIIEPAKDLIWHNGSTIGFKSILAISKTQGIAVVAMTDTGLYSTGSDGEVIEDPSLQNSVFECLK